LLQTDDHLKKDDDTTQTTEPAETNSFDSEINERGKEPINDDENYHTNSRKMESSKKVQEGRQKSNQNLQKLLERNLVETKDPENRQEIVEQLKNLKSSYYQSLGESEGLAKDLATQSTLEILKEEIFKLHDSQTRSEFINEWIRQAKGLRGFEGLSDKESEEHAIDLLRDNIGERLLQEKLDTWLPFDEVKEGVHKPKKFDSLLERLFEISNQESADRPGNIRPDVEDMKHDGT